jgi:hypothetical protein
MKVLQYPWHILAMGKEEEEEEEETIGIIRRHSE